MKRKSSGSEERERIVYEFDGFRADPVRRVLSHRGEPVAITPKALSILLVLLERAGEVVDKKELIGKVWPGVFVSEANLTQNVFSLRKTLGERAAGTRYIVTVPGQGYSFAREVQRLERISTSEIPIVVDAPPPPAAEGSTRDELAAEGASPAPAALPVTPPGRRSSLGVLAVLLTLVAIGAVLFGLLQAARQPPVPGTGDAGAVVRPAIAVLDFKSLSPGDDTRWLDTAFAEMLTTELAAGGSMRVIRGEAVAQAWRSLALRDPGSMGRAGLKRLHEALGADFVVVGSYLPIHGKIRLDLRVLQARGGETVVSVSEVGTEPELFELVSRTGGKLRKSLDIAELSPQQVRETRAQRPSSRKAHRLYAEGLVRLRAFDPPGALESLQQAAAADPESAVIHSSLSQAWSVLGYDARAVAEARRALALAGSLPREERLAIEGRLHKAAKDWEKASQTYRSLWTFFPDDVDYGLQLAESLLASGRGAEAVEALAALRKLPPPAGEDPRIDLVEARNARRLADFATEKRAAETAGNKGRRSRQSLVVAQALIYQGDALLKLGRPREAIRLFRESAALCDQAGYQWGIGMAQANVGVGLQILGDLEGAQEASEESLAIARRLGSAIGIAAQLYQLGELHRDRGELPEALALLEQSRQWCVRMGDRLMEARALNAAGTVLLARGDLGAARQRFETALTLSESLGNPMDEASSLDNLAAVLAARGELGEARRRHGEAFAILLRAGDSSRAASALAAWADAAARVGDVGAAWQRSAQALAAKQRAGDRIGAGRILGSRAWLAYEMGDLAASQAMAEDQLRIARETGAKSLAAWGLQNLGRVDFAAGDLAGARESFAEALRSARSESLRAMEIRLELAGLALAEDRAGEAASLARETAAWYRAQGIPGGETAALSLLAEALLRRGLRAEARQAAAGARAKLETSEDRELRVTAGVRLARIEAATGSPQEALELLRHAAAEAARSGLAAAGLEARLALGQVRRGLRDPAAEAALAAVRKEARERGFKRLAASRG
jgi:eukaryotic-like serine/threonine-protein kinase